jgi:hypothetical protein
VIKNRPRTKLLIDGGDVSNPASFDSRDEAGIEPSDEGVRFLHFWGKHLENYNSLGNGCLLIGLSQKYGKPTLRPRETMSVNTCAFSGTNPAKKP